MKADLNIPQARLALTLWQMASALNAIGGDRADQAAELLDAEAVQVAASIGLAYSDFCDENGDDQELRACPTIENMQAACMAR